MFRLLSQLLNYTSRITCSSTKSSESSNLSMTSGANEVIGLLRRRTKGFRDSEYLKLRIYQFDTSDRPVVSIR